MGTEAGGLKPVQWQLLVCINRRLTPAAVSCAGRGSERLARKAADLLAAAELPVEVKPVYCFGRCGKGPNFRLAPGGEFYCVAADEDIPELIEQIRLAIQPG